MSSLSTFVIASELNLHAVPSGRRYAPLYRMQLQFFFFFFFSFDCVTILGNRVAIYANAMIHCRSSLCPQVKIFDALLRLNSYLTRCLISSTLLVNHIRLSNSREDLAGRNSFARL